MFDIGFAELLILSVVALLVLGPERLPGALRALGLWIGRLRRTMGNLQAELEREIGMDELRRELHNDRILEEARALEKDLRDTDRAVREGTRALESEARAEGGGSGGSGPPEPAQAAAPGAGPPDGVPEASTPPSGPTAPPWDPADERRATPRDPYGDLDAEDLHTGAAQDRETPAAPEREPGGPGSAGSRGDGDEGTPRASGAEGEDAPRDELPRGDAAGKGR